MRLFKQILGILGLVAGFVVLVLLSDRAQQVRDHDEVASFVEERRAFAADSFVTLAELGTSLRESSGLAVSRRHQGVVWTHNDSGGGPILHAVRMDGTVVRRFRLDADARDWEAMDLGSCPGAPNDDCLYIGDVGDNNSRWPTVRILVLPEPDPTDDTAGVLPHRTLELMWSEGPDDVEAIAVDASGRLTAVTKGRSGRFLAYHVEPAQIVEALDGAPLTVPMADQIDHEPNFRIGRMVSGAGYSPSGRRLAVRTYTEIYFFTVADDGRLVPDGEACLVGGREPQGEAVAFLDERVLLTTSEEDRGIPAALFRIVCP